MTINRIRFIHSDKRYPHLDQIAEELAEFLINYQSKLDKYRELMRISTKWTVSNSSYKNELSMWVRRLKGRNPKNAAYDTLKLADLAFKFFSSCSNDYEVKKLRGLVPEKIMEKIFIERYKNKKIYNYGFGKIVVIDNVPVYYQCANPFETERDSDGSRQTVDVGFWDGEKGEFAEIKFDPEAFHTKDVNYLRLLSSELQSKKIDNLIYLISMGNKYLTMKKLEELNLWNPSEFELIGHDEIFSLQEVI